MTHPNSPGWRLREAVLTETPLKVVGTINAISALMAKQIGFKAIYLSGAGVANASFGLPDLGITSRDNVLEDVRRITGTVDLPLLVDGDTGWGDAFGIERTIKTLHRAGAAGVHLEDQVSQKRCGHRPGKQVVSTDEMCDRIKAAINGKSCADFVIMARTDAYGVEGLQAAIDRAAKYVEAGADMIFAEAMTTLEEYKQFTSAISVPVLANITEFGKTPLFTVDELAKVGVQLVLYPLSAFRAMNKAALMVYQAIHQQGTQQSVLPLMQTRDELYELLNYLSYEQKMDSLLEKK
jgi:methylisocitrate lyase